MLIDAGQVFRCLVVAATNRGIDLTNPDAIDAFLGDEQSAEECVSFVKAVYHMQKIDRDALLYSPEVSVNSAKIGARPLSQAFKDMLLEKWLRDAHDEGFEIVLLDGRALEEVGKRLEADGLCNFKMGLYFICDSRVGAMRTLGFAHLRYDDLIDADKRSVDEFAAQIEERNRADRERSVQPIVPPADSIEIALPDMPDINMGSTRLMAVVDTSSDMAKPEMAEPIIRLVSRLTLP